MAGHPGEAARRARRGEFAAASRLAEEAMALLEKAEVAQMCGELGEAESCARQALQFYEDRQMLPRAEQARALLDRLIEQRSTLKS